MAKRTIIFAVVLIGILAAAYFIPAKENATVSPQTSQSATKEPLHALTIEAQRIKEYPGSEIKIEEELENGSNYKRYLTSYQSDGLKIYSLLTVPTSKKPESGFPAIIFNHGYIP